MKEFTPAQIEKGLKAFEGSVPWGIPAGKTFMDCLLRCPQWGGEEFYVHGSEAAAVFWAAGKYAEVLKLDPAEQSEKLTAHAYKWAREYQAGYLEDNDIEGLQECMRQCVEEWIGETRQAPLKETEEEIKNFLSNLG